MKNNVYTILIVDDDEDDIFNIKDILKGNKSLQIEYINNGEDFINYMIDEKKPVPSLVLLDINMPKKNGLDALKEVRNRGHKTPIVIFTSSDLDRDIQKSYELGANSYVTKPIHFYELENILENLTQYWFGFVKLPTGDDNGK